MPRRNYDPYRLEDQWIDELRKLRNNEYFNKEETRKWKQ